MSFSPLTNQLIDALRCLPGVGPKTAQRMAFHLLERDRENGKHLSEIIHQAMNKIGHCEKCRTFSETPLCNICQNPKRDPSLICLVETPADILAIEQTHIYQGLYFVLMGHLSPLDGIGPDELGLNILQKQLTESPIKEIILATSHTVEGEATAHYIKELIKPFNMKISRIAHGIPMGGELEYIDSRTLADALMDRKDL